MPGEAAPGGQVVGDGGLAAAHLEDAALGDGRICSRSSRTRPGAAVEVPAVEDAVRALPHVPAELGLSPKRHPD